MLRATAELAPPGLTIEAASIREFPLYDVEAERMPEAVREVQERIAAADGLLLVTALRIRAVSGGNRACPWDVGLSVRERHAIYPS